MSYELWALSFIGDAAVGRVLLMARRRRLHISSWLMAHGLWAMSYEL